MIQDMDLSPKDPKGRVTLARVLAILRAEEIALRQRGIVHAGVFGSVPVATRP